MATDESKLDASKEENEPDLNDLAKTAFESIASYVQSDLNSELEIGFSVVKYFYNTILLLNFRKKILVSLKVCRAKWKKETSVFCRYSPQNTLMHRWFCYYMYTFHVSPKLPSFSIAATVADYNLLLDMNRIGTQKYSDMRHVAAGISKSLADLNDRCKSF